MKRPRRQIRNVVTYFGVNIYRNTEPGYRLRWSTIAPSLAADTLAGVKQLIREELQDFSKTATPICQPK